MNWIDTAVVGIVVVGGLFVFYRALKEPIDQFFRFLGWAFGGIRNKVSGGIGGGPETVGRVITYD